MCTGMSEGSYLNVDLIQSFQGRAGNSVCLASSQVIPMLLVRDYSLSIKDRERPKDRYVMLHACVRAAGAQEKLPQFLIRPE